MFITLFVICIISFIIFVKWRQNYWQRIGVPTPNQEFLFGDARKFIFGQTSFGDMALDRYKKLRALGSPHGGVYFFWMPTYVPIDPSIIKDMLQRNFSHFVDRGVYHHPKDILSMHLFNLEGEEWRTLRAKLTPTFTSGKMRMMFETLMNKAECLERKVGEFAVKQEPFAIKDILGRFTTDIIGSCAFGIECDSMEDPDNDFRKYGKKLFQIDPKKFISLVTVPREILVYLGFRRHEDDVSEFFINIVKDTIRMREANEIYRRDFMHLLLQLKNQGFTNDSARVTSENGIKGECFLSEDDIIAQCLVFFAAGFETSSTTMTFALLELAQNPEIQSKLRKEIDTVLAKHDGKITYDSIKEMSYLEKIINETLRKFPPAPVLPRVCTKDYKVPGTNVVIKKGTRAHIPVWGLHMDPQYYPNPEKFDPERFNEENKASRPDFTFLPFGEGPRICIGLRFGMVQSKVGLVSLIRNFDFSLNERTALPVEMDRKMVVLSAKGEVWLDAKKIVS